MRHLFLVRHAKSSWNIPGLRDFDRPLNDRGRHDAPRMGQLLQNMGVKPDLLVSSPAKRALTTAQYFAEALGIPTDAIVQESNIYDAFATDILAIVRALPDSAQVVCLFGHNPTFTDVANRFSDTGIDNVPTCGVVYLESSAARWEELRTENTRVQASFFPKQVLGE
ncbi:MAG: histidine phosphatase family protein [Lewinellaceae bacterium]|nr:histidine phosphatase family protein [Lewinellaceae bacterium]